MVKASRAAARPRLAAAAADRGRFERDGWTEAREWDKDKGANDLRWGGREWDVTVALPCGPVRRRDHCEWAVLPSPLAASEASESSNDLGVALKTGFLWGLFLARWTAESDETDDETDVLEELGSKKGGCRCGCVASDRCGRRIDRVRDSAGEAMDANASWKVAWWSRRRSALVVAVD